MREELVAVQRAPVGQCRHGHAVVPPVEQRERTGDGAAAVAEHAHAGGQAARVAHVDELIAGGEPPEGERADPVPALGPHGGQPLGLERGEVQPRGDDLTQHGWAPEGPPRGIRRAIQREFQQHPHEARVGRADAAAKRHGRIPSACTPSRRTSAGSRLAHMPEGLWWLPSLLVFGAAGLAVVGGVVGARRLGARRERTAIDAGRSLEVRAKGLIVQADNAVRDADREVAFAEAQFGPAVARDVRTALETARERLREAFLLQQRLDDAEPHSAEQRRTWSTRIVQLCESALGAIHEADAALAERRRAEHGASQGLPALREDAARLSRRRQDTAVALDRLATRFTPAALGRAEAAAQRVDSALGAATSALDTAETRLARSEPAADRLSTVADLLDRASRDLAEIEGVELALAAAQADAAAAAQALDADLVEARRERDGAEDAEAQSALGAAIGEASAVMAARSSTAGDPFADRDRVRAARDRLEVARATARNAQGRLDGARGALGGAIAIAESQLRVARAAIERGAGRVGADARTRLAEGERQLVMARQEPDPVAALDAARRAASRASDAEALAAYDTMGGGR